MPIFERFSRQVQRETGAINNLAGAAESELARELESFSARRQDELDRSAAAQSEALGETAGAQGQLGVENPRTIRQQAFARGAMVAHQAAVQTDIRDSVGRFQIEHPDDPEAFTAKVEGLREGLLTEADPRMQTFIQQRVADYAGRASLSVIEAQQNKIRKEAEADLQRGADGLLEDATTAAFEGDVPMTEARRQEVTSLLAEAVDGELIEQGAADEMLQQFERAVTSQEVVGEFDRLVREQGSEVGPAAIQRWQSAKPSEVGLTVDDHKAVTRELLSSLNRQQALENDQKIKITSAFRAEQDQRQGRVSDAIDVLKQGFPVDADQAKQITKDIGWLLEQGTEVDRAAAAVLAGNFDVANAIQGQVHRFRRMPPQARAAELAALESSLRTGGASADQVELLKALKTTSAEVNTQLDQDPRGYVVREGLVDETPIDFSSADAFADSLTARGASGEIGRQLTGDPLPLLTAAEADQLAKVYEDAQIEEKVGLLGVITAGAGEQAEATLEQLDKKGHKRMALLGSYVLAGEGVLARDIMRGEAILTSDPGIKPKRTDYQADLDSAWGAALSDWPGQRDQYTKAAFAKYADLKAREGDISDAYDPGLMEQALEAVLPTARFNGRRVAIPPGVTEDHFEDWSDAWTAEDFVGVPGTDPAELLELVQDRGRLVELGNGRYGVSLSSAADDRDRFLVTETGEPFILKFKTPE